MKRILSDETVLKMLDKLDLVPLVGMESDVLEFKGWDGGKKEW